jgi:hypothetical protein
MNRSAKYLAIAVFSTGCLTPLLIRAQTDAATKIATAVLPLPKEMRDSATVIDVTGGGKIDTLRKGTSDMVCAYHTPVVPQGSKTADADGFAMQDGERFNDVAPPPALPNRSICPD